MGARFRDLGDALRRVTKFSVACPSCGRVGVAAWTREENVVSCRGCGARFDYRPHTYRPVTGDMDEKGRAEYYREQQRAYDRTPGRLEAHRFTAARYYREHRDEVCAKARARYAANREAVRNA